MGAGGGTRHCRVVVGGDRREGDKLERSCERETRRNKVMVIDEEHLSGTHTRAHTHTPPLSLCLSLPLDVEIIPWEINHISIGW